jgi:hypothetical protein
MMDIAHIRDITIAVNQEFSRLLPDPVLINVGSEPNAGDGDRFAVGMAKILDNLKRLPHQPYRVEIRR